MTKTRSVTHSILMWSHGRGTLQYDIMCALILAFIFFVPPSCFVKRKTYGQPLSQHDTHTSPSEDNADVPKPKVQENK